MFRRVFIGLSVILALVMALTVGVVAYAQTATPPPQPTATFWEFLARRLNSTPAAVQQAMRDAGKDVVAQALTAGKLSQAQADRAIDRIDRWQGQLPLGLQAGRGGDRGKAFLPLSQAALDAAAKALGLSTDSLKAELQKGQSLRQIAQARSIDPATVEKAVADALKAEVDTARAAGKLTQAQADQAKARIDQRLPQLMDAAPGALKRGLPGPQARPFAPQSQPFGPAGRPFGPLMAGVGDSYAAAAQALGISTEDLRAELQKGQSLRQIAQARNVDPAIVQQAIVTSATAHIDQAVTAGKLTADQASQAKQRVTDMATRLMDAQPRPFPRPAPKARL